MGKWRVLCTGWALRSDLSLLNVLLQRDIQRASFVGFVGVEVSRTVIGMVTVMRIKYILHPV